MLTPSLVVLYADDCVLYLSGNNWLGIKQRLQEYLDCFEHWGELNNLHLNVSKTKLMVAGTHSKLLKLGNMEPLKLYGRDIPIDAQYNYLGVILDAEITIRPFINHVKKNVYVKIFALSKLRNCLTEYASVMIYKHMILPYLEYAGFMLSACSLDERRELQICQNDALRICLRIFFDSDFIYPGKGFGFRQFTIPSQPLIVTLARVSFRVTDS